MPRQTLPERSDPATGSRQRSIQSIEIGFELIKVLERADGPLTLKELAHRAAMPASKAHFYLVSFKRIGLVAQDEDGGRYALGRYALDLGLSALRRLDLVEVARDALRALSSEIGASVFLSIWGNRGPTIVFKVDGPRRIPMTLQVGFVLPLLTSATGRIFLTFSPTAQTADLLAEERSTQSTRIHDPFDVEALKQHIAAIGIAETESLLNDGFSGMAAPVWNHQNELAGSVTIIGPSEDRSAVAERDRGLLVATSRRLSLAMGRADPIGPGQ